MNKEDKTRREYEAMIEKNNRDEAPCLHQYEEDSEERICINCGEEDDML
jgi:hypothetical protein